jgi:AraC family transcriptional regulator
MNNNPRTYLDNIYPYLLFAQQYFFSPGQTAGPRICYASTIVLIMKGYGSLKMNDQVYIAKPGALFYIPTGKKHRWEASETDPMTHRCSYFDWKYKERPGFTHQNDYFCSQGELIREEYLGPKIHLQLNEYSIVKDISAWLSRFDQFTSSPEMLDERYFPESLIIRGHFQLFLNLFIKHMINLVEYIDPRIQKTIDLIEHMDDFQSGRIMENLIGTMAQKSGLSRSHFHALFKKYTRYSPKAYLLHTILVKTMEELKYTNLSVTDIADKYAFSSIHYFSKAFRKMTGFTPTEYRSKNQIY